MDGKLLVFSLPSAKSFSNKLSSFLINKYFTKHDLIVNKFSDGEFRVYFPESIRGHRIFIVCSTRSSDDIIQILLSLDAARRSGAQEVHLIIPYFGYSRQDKREIDPDMHRGSIGASMVAKVLEVGGANSIITMDLHASQLEGFFSIPVVHISSSEIFTSYLSNKISEDSVIVSPDLGGMLRASNISSKLGLKTAVIDKKRVKANEVDSMSLIGEVHGKHCYIVDDIADTCGTLVKASDLLLEKGALSVSAIITHPILSGKAKERLINSNIKTLYVTDSINCEDIFSDMGDKVKVLSSCEVFANVITAIHNKESTTKKKIFYGIKAKTF